MRSGTYMDARAFSTRFGQTLVSESKERERVLLIPECGFEWSLLHVTSGGSHLKKKKNCTRDAFESATATSQRLASTAFCVCVC